MLADLALLWAPQKRDALVPALQGCMRAHHVFNLAVYQPASRFWLLQGIETAIFGGLALGLLAGAVWWVRNRAS